MLKTIQKWSLAIWSAVVLHCLLGIYVYAQEVAPVSGPKNKQELINFAKNVTTVFYNVFFVIAAFFFVLAAYRMLFAKDNATEFEKGKKSLFNGLIAVAVALLASGFASIISSFLTSMSK